MCNLPKLARIFLAREIFAEIFAWRGENLAWDFSIFLGAKYGFENHTLHSYEKWLKSYTAQASSPCEIGFY